MRINPVNYSYKIYHSRKNVCSFECKDSLHQQSVLLSYPQSYYLSFSSSRVDKGLARFYAFNAEKMPVTVRDYIQSLTPEQVALETPLRAQYNAFDFLELCSSLEDVKCVYPNEPLFSAIKNLEDTKPSRGFIYDAKLMKDDIEASGEYIIKDEPNFTLYLLKKIFLDAKTVKEINEDIHLLVNPILQREDKNYIAHSTLRSLGIHMPNMDYMNSLRYTRVGYSDSVGESISKYWASLSEEERLDRKTNASTSRSPMSPQKAAELREKRSELMRRRWQEMSPEEKVDYIEKMKSGSEEESVSMVHAWNICSDVREQLSFFFLQHNFYNPLSIIYSNGKFSLQMKKLMTSFWAQNPDSAKKLGFAIKESNKEIEESKANGTYEDFKLQIYQTQKDIKSLIKVKRNEKKQELKANKNAIDAFKTAYGANFFFLPKDFLDCYYSNMSKMPTEQLLVWAKKFSGEKLNNNEQKILEESRSFLIDDPEYLKKRDAINAAMMTVLINSLTFDSKSDIGAITYSDFRGLSSIMIHVLTKSMEFKVDTQIGPRILKFARKPKPKDIREKYDNYSRPISLQDANKLADALLEGCNVTESQRDYVVDNLSQRCHVYAELLKAGFNPRVKFFLLTNLQNDFSNINNFGEKLKCYIRESKL